MNCNACGFFKWKGGKEGSKQKQIENNLSNPMYTFLKYAKFIIIKVSS